MKDEECLEMSPEPANQLRLVKIKVQLSHSEIIELC